MYAPAKVANTSAWIPLVNVPSNIIGIGITNGTKEIRTATTSSSATTLPNRRKLKDSGLVKSSNTLIGNKNAAGDTYRLK